MELRHLRTFETVVRTLNLTEAARDLHYAQSSVSEQIQALEKELGVQLIDRTQRRIRLTAEGSALSLYADRILKLVEEARFEVGRVGEDLTVGALETISMRMLPAILQDFRSAHPQARIKLAQGNRGELYQAVGRGDMDLCLTFGKPPADRNLRAETLGRESLVVIVPPAHHLAAAQVIDLADLAGASFMATASGCGFREMYDRSLAGKVALEPVTEVASIATLGACVAAGMGCALLPLISVHDQAERGEVSVVRIGDADLHTPVIMTWLERNSAHPGLTAFQETIRRRFAA